jgi:uncharacterized protein YkwD
MGDLRRTAFALLALLAIWAPASPAPAAAPTPTAVSSAELALVDQINRARARYGLARLRHSPELARSARRYSRWQLRNGYFGHQPTIRMSRRYSTRAEVLGIAGGTRVSARRTVQSWLESPSHRAAILNRSMRYAGAGIASGRFRGRRSVIVTVHLGG